MLSGGPHGRRHDRCRAEHNVPYSFRPQVARTRLGPSRAMEEVRDEKEAARLAVAVPVRGGQAKRTKEEMT